MITLPGFIDPHVHLRTPGQTYKEDFLTGTSAALAGGFTTVIDMPNNKTPITSLSLLKKKKEIAKKKIVCDVGFYFGSLGDNLSEFEKVEDRVFGLKLYLNQTTGNFVINKESLLKIYDSWFGSPVLVHAEQDVIDLVIDVCSRTKKRTHVCHVSEIGAFKKIIAAKKKGLPITFGVTPHHLFIDYNLSKRLGPYALMKPQISEGFKEFAWKNLKHIDVIESDHAPHSYEEKKILKTAPFGVPGLETTLGLLLTACSDGLLSIKDIKRLCHDGPAKIFGINPSTGSERDKIVVDENEEWIVRGKNLQTKCKWSPFEGWRLKGKIKKVYIRNKLVFDNGRILVKPGFGRVL
ncbi:MAG: dihydroorotase family protein [Patescibacteria group bacterium]